MSTDAIIELLLEKRGITADERETFLSPDYEKLHDPFLMPDMERAVERLFTAMRENETIAIYSDFDCDGIPGNAVLSDFFKRIGYEYVLSYIPHRDREGYGFHVSAIDSLKKNNVSVIITVDVGTVAVEGVSHAQDIGIDVIVTDHHELHGEAAPAYALINPKRDPYPFKELCGAGTAFKLVQGLLARGREMNDPRFTSIPLGWEKWLLDLVAIATVADMVPLTGENRILTYWGLQVLRKSRRLGIAALCNTARARKADLTEDDIGFLIAPRINAASRMDEPELAFRLLTTKEPFEADTLAKRLEELNASRKGVVSGIVREAKKKVKARFAPEDRVVVLGDTEWKPSLLGLAANSILENRKGIVCMWGRDANGNLKGSCRTDGSVSMVELFTHAKDAVIEFGGHHASGGFSVSHAQVHEMHERLAQALPLCEPREEKESVTFDIEVPAQRLSWSFYETLASLAPYGLGNAKPILSVTARVTSVRLFGKDKNHTEVLLTCDNTGARIRAFQFFRKPDVFSFEPRSDFLVTIIGTLERDSFKGPSEIALRIRDVHAPVSAA